MAKAFNKFNSTVEALAHKKHDLSADQIKVALTNILPVAANSVLVNITEVDYTYCSSRNITTASSGQTDGTYVLVLTDLEISASGGVVGPFRYIVLYNDTASNDELLGWSDYGSSITLADGEKITLDFAENIFTLA